LCYIGELSTSWWCQIAPELWEIQNQPGYGLAVADFTQQVGARARLALAEHIRVQDLKNFSE